MAIPLNPSGKKRPKTEILPPKKKDTEILPPKKKDKEDEMCDCPCHDSPGMKHFRACCKRCGEQRVKKS